MMRKTNTYGHRIADEITRLVADVASGRPLSTLSQPVHA